MKLKELNQPLQELHRLMGQEALLELLIAYKAQVLEFEEIIKRSTTKTPELAAASHKIRSASWSMGETELAAFCDKIEKATEVKDILSACKLCLTRVNTRVDYFIRGLSP